MNEQKEGTHRRYKYLAELPLGHQYINYLKYFATDMLPGLIMSAL